MKNKYICFGDGIVSIYSVANSAKKGDRPKETLSIKYALRFCYKTIGIKRNYEAMQAQVDLNEMICIPLHRDISTQDVAVINGKQYKIVQAQYIKDTAPPSALLTLSRLEADYDFK